MEPKAGIGSHSNLSDVARHIEKASRHQFHAAIPCAGVAWTQFGIPEIGRVGFDAQERIVRTFASITGVVADLGTLLTPEDRHHAAVEIEDQTGSVVGYVNEILQQSIIHAMYLPQKRVRSLK